MFQGRLHSRFHDRQTQPNSSLILVEFETYYIKTNPPLIFPPTKYAMVLSHFTLCSRTRDYLKRLSQHPWHGLWTRVKGPHHYKVTALGLWSVKQSPTLGAHTHANPCYGFWVGMGVILLFMGGHRSLLMGVVWVWVQIRRKCWALVWSGP